MSNSDAKQVTPERISLTPASAAGGKARSCSPAGALPHGRNGEIDLLRFVYAFIIVLHHTRYLLGDEHCLFLGGSFSVEFFFLVSGILMAASAEHAGERYGRAGEKIPLGSETADFLKRKLRGFLPEFLPAWLIGFTFVCIVRGKTPHGVLRQFLNDFFEVTLLRMSGLFRGGIDGVIWYVSAMLLVMAVLYPLLRRFPSMETHIIAPLTALFLLGYMMQTSGHPRNPAQWESVVFKGILRATAELSLGIVCFRFVKKLRRRTPRIVSGVFVFAVHALLIRYMYRSGPTKDDFFYLFFLAAALALTFAGMGLTGTLLSAASDKISLSGRIPAFFAKFSSSLFFSHLYYAQNLGRILPEAMDAREKVFVYLVCSFATAGVVYCIAGTIRKHRDGIRNGLKKLAFRPEKEA